jgi:rod shape determining protein RodA
VRWIPIGGYTIQPSELVKPFLVLISAWFWSKREFSFQRLLQFALLFLPPLVLIFLQPDLGSTLVVLSIFAGAILTSGIKIKQLLVLMLIGILLIPLFWFSLHDYPENESGSFINPYSDPLGQGYNVMPGKNCLGSGGLFGGGWAEDSVAICRFCRKTY